MADMTETMTAGPALDAEIARRVFGAKVRDATERMHAIVYDPGFGRVRPYSTDIAAAWLVFKAGLEAFGTAQITADMEHYGRQSEDIMTVTFGWDHREGRWTGPICEAICLAYLDALDQNADV